MEEKNELSNAFDKLGEMLESEEGQKQISDIISMLSGPADESPNNPEDKNDTTNPLSGILNSTSFSGIADMLSSSGGQSAINHGIPDLDMLSKAKKIMSFAGGKNNPNAAFLTALKPFLHKERRQKVDSAIKILGFASIFKEFGGTLKGGE